MLRLITLSMLACLMLSPARAAADETPFFTPFHNLNTRDWSVSNGWVNGDYQACEWRTDEVKTVGDHLQMSVTDQGGQKRPYGCAELHTTSRYTYGTYEVRMRTAAGAGLNSAFFTYIGPPAGVKEWDEIDFEFLGKDTHSVQLNYYVNGKGGHEKIVPLGFDASADFHNYAFQWMPDEILFYVDGKLVHKTPAGAEIPNNPGNIFLSLWAGGAQMNSWLGAFNYAAPVTAEVEWTAYSPMGANCQFHQSILCH